MRNEASAFATPIIITTLVLSLLAIAQTPADPKTPELEPSKRIEILTLANQRHVIQEQIDQITIRFLQNQSQAQSDLSSSQQRMNVIQGQIDQTSKAVNYDREKFELDPDTATFRAKPTPGNPTGPQPATPKAGEKAKTK